MTEIIFLPDFQGNRHRNIFQLITLINHIIQSPLKPSSQQSCALAKFHEVVCWEPNAITNWAYSSSENIFYSICFPSTQGLIGRGLHASEILICFIIMFWSISLLRCLQFRKMTFFFSALTLVAVLLTDTKTILYAKIFEFNHTYFSSFTNKYHFFYTQCRKPQKYIAVSKYYCKFIHQNKHF